MKKFYLIGGYTMIKIKKIDKSDLHILEEFIYWAIFTPPGFELPERSIVLHQSISIYIENFGNEKGDCGVFAETGGKAVGAAWTRIIPAFGHIDNDTPELAISVLPEFRNKGIGVKLMEKLFEYLTWQNYRQTSLSVQKENPALNFYLRLGYKIVGEKTEEYLMIKQLTVS